MSFADDLLNQAYHLISYEHPGPPKQASLRRAVSTAYNALFRLLIDEAVGHWGVARQRTRLARTFEHRAMKKVCEDLVKTFYSSGEPPSGATLKYAAQTFIELQQKRETADYDNSNEWTYVNAESWLDKASGAFLYWRDISTTDEAQDFLLALFLPKLARQ
jgi:uncharacterized protein (UPF0332 family)